MAENDYERLAERVTANVTPTDTQVLDWLTAQIVDGMGWIYGPSFTTGLMGLQLIRSPHGQTTPRQAIYSAMKAEANRDKD